MDKILGGIIPHQGQERRVKRRTTLTPSLSPRRGQPDTQITNVEEPVDVPLPATPPDMQVSQAFETHPNIEEADNTNINPDLQRLFRRPPATLLNSASTSGPGRRTREVVTILTDTINRLIRAAEDD